MNSSYHRFNHACVVIATTVLLCVGESWFGVRAFAQDSRSAQRDRYESLRSGEAVDWPLGSATDMTIHERAISALRIKALNEAHAQRVDKITAASARYGERNPWLRLVKDRPSVSPWALLGTCVLSPVVDAFGDASDTFGSGPPLLDIDTVSVSTDGVNLSFSMTFHTPISAPSGGAADSVGGFLEFDTDQNAATGLSPVQNAFSPPFVASGLGVDFYVDLFSELSSAGLVNILDASFNVTGTIPITYGPQSLSGTIPLGMLGGDNGIVDFTAIIGTIPQPTDVLEVCGFNEPCFDNPSFESGNFTSWVTQDLLDPFVTLQVAGGGLSPGFGFFLSSPTDGAFAVLHGWDGDGPGTIVVAQDVSLPAGATTVSFDYRGAWDMTFGATQDRTFEVVIRPAGGGAPLQAPDLLLTASAGSTQFDTGSLLGQVDVSAFAGQTIRISFEWFVPEFFTGPAFFQLDNVRCEGAGGGGDPFEPDDTPVEATEVSCGTQQTHTVDEDGDVDWFAITLGIGTVLTVETSNLSGSNPDTAIELYDDGCGFLTFDDDGGSGLASRLEWTATYAGTHYIKARSFGGSLGLCSDLGGGPADMTYDISFDCLVCSSLPIPSNPAPPDGATDVPVDTTLCWNGGPKTAKIIYGADDRLDVYEVSDAAILAAADATVGLVFNFNVTDNGDGTFSLPSGSFTDSFLNNTGFPLCASEPFRDQPVPAFCSGFLVAPDLIATAGHCIVDAADCAATTLVFGFDMLDATTPVLTLPESDVYHCSSIVGRVLTAGADWAVVRLDRSVVGHTPVPIRRTGTISDGRSLLLIGHPSGLPTKIAGGAIVRDNTPSAYFQANVDAYGGNSGSAVFDATTLDVEGILVRGNTDFVLTGSCIESNTCPDGGCPGWEDSTRTTEFAHLVPEIQVDEYDVYFGPCGNLQLQETTTDTCWSPPMLSQGTTYCWQIIARNACEEIPGPVWSFTSESDCLCDGDINGDGVLTALDLALAVNCVAGIHVDPKCDVNCDGVVTPRDLSDVECIFRNAPEIENCCEAPRGVCCDVDNSDPRFRCWEYVLFHGAPPSCEVDFGEVASCSLVRCPGDTIPLQMNRFIPVLLPSGTLARETDTDTAIQIELTTLNHICAANTNFPFKPCLKHADCPCPNPLPPNSDCISGTCETEFGESEGQVRYVNVVRTCQGGCAEGKLTCRSVDDCPKTCQGDGADNGSSCANNSECDSGNCQNMTCVPSDSGAACEVCDVNADCDSGLCENLSACIPMRTCQGGSESGDVSCSNTANCMLGGECLLSMTCPDDEFKPGFLCATTGCDPQYRDWASDLAGGVLHVYGPGIVPGRSVYGVRQLPASCTGNEESCPSASEVFLVATARWADMTADGAINSRDITAASNKVQPIPEALTKPRTMLISGILNPLRNVNVLELQNTIDAVRELPMPGFITGPEDCGG